MKNRLDIDVLVLANQVTVPDSQSRIYTLFPSQTMSWWVNIIGAN